MAEETPSVETRSSPFLCDSAFVDVMHRLGFRTEVMNQLESFWWFMAADEVSPDDVASALMKILPYETEEQANKRRAMDRMGMDPVPMRKLRAR